MAINKYKELNISLPFSARDLTSLLDENHLELENPDILKKKKHLKS